MDNTSNLLALTGLVLAVLALLAVGLGLLWFARRTQRRTGLPA